MHRHARLFVILLAAMLATTASAKRRSVAERLWHSSQQKQRGFVIHRMYEPVRALRETAKAYKAEARRVGKEATAVKRLADKTDWRNQRELYYQRSGKVDALKARKGRLLDTAEQLLKTASELSTVIATAFRHGDSEKLSIWDGGKKQSLPKVNFSRQGYMTDFYYTASEGVAQRLDEKMAYTVTLDKGVTRPLPLMPPILRLQDISPHYANALVGDSQITVLMRGVFQESGNLTDVRFTFERNPQKLESGNGHHIVRIAQD